MNHLLRIVLVEDNAADANLMKEYIEMTGVDAQIINMRNGREAIDFLKLAKNEDEWPDLVLLDLNLPIFNGHEVLQTIRGEDCKMRVFIYSGSRLPEDIMRAERNGANGYIFKPTSGAEIESVVDKLRDILNSIY